MKQSNDYTLPESIDELFTENCYFSYGLDLHFYQYIFETFHKKGQLPDDKYELLKLAVALVKFHHSITARLEDEYYDPYDIDYDKSYFPLEVIIEYHYDYNDNYLNEDYSDIKYDKSTGIYFIQNVDEEDDQGVEVAYSEDLDELGYEFDYGGFIDFCYDDSDIVSLLCQHFTPSEVFILIMVFEYDFDEDSDTITSIDSYNDYLTSINDKGICHELVNSNRYVEGYSHVFAEIEELM